jgi:hypothetical protein
MLGTLDQVPRAFGKEKEPSSDGERAKYTVQRN